MRADLMYSQTVLVTPLAFGHYNRNPPALQPPGRAGFFIRLTQGMGYGTTNARGGVVVPPLAFSPPIYPANKGSFAPAGATRAALERAPWTPPNFSSFAKKQAGAAALEGGSSAA